MKILTNKEYEYLLKCKEHYEKAIERWRKVNNSPEGRSYRKKYWDKNRNEINTKRAETYRQTHPNARTYKKRS